MGPMVAPVDYAASAVELRRAALGSMQATVDRFLRRFEEVEGELRAFLPDETAEERRTRLMRAAEQLARRFPLPDRRPPLFGAVVGIKDLFRVDGFPTRAGSSLPATLFSGRQSSAVGKLIAAGALVLGKTVSTEFAYFGPGPTRNPWNPAHTPGGSSSGSAAAVAGGMCHLALGTQTIGSITRPATYCGLAGFKPSFGRIPADGAVPFSRSADHVGVIAPTVATAAIAASVLCDSWQPGPLDATQPGTLLVPARAYLEQADSAALRAFEAALEVLQRAGWRVERSTVLTDIERINSTHTEMIAAEFAHVHATWFSVHHRLYHPKSVELIERGRTIREDRLIQARRGRDALREEIEAALRIAANGTSNGEGASTGGIGKRGPAIWIAPATTGEAPNGLEATGSPLMNLPWTYAGVPTVSMTTGVGPGGMPLGIQISAPMGEDETLLSIGSHLESLLRTTAT